MTEWIATPEINAEVEHGAGKSVVTGPVTIVFHGPESVYIHTNAHVNDDLPALTYRGREYRVNLHLEHRNGTWAERDNLRYGGVEQRHSFSGNGVAKTIRSAIVNAVTATVAEHWTTDQGRRAQHASAAQELHRVESERAELVAKLAALDERITKARATLERTATSDREVTMYQVPTAQTLNTLHPGSRVRDAQGRTHTLNNVITEIEVESGKVIRAAGYSQQADGWLDMLTGRIKSGPWMEAQPTLAT